MKTLIDDFEEEKLRSHREPSRKGIALKKGTRIGYPLPKEKAVLWTMRGKTQKEIAEKLELDGVSFSQVRIWASESAFKRKVEAYSEEVVSRFLARLEAFERESSNEDLKGEELVEKETEVPADFGKTKDYGRPLALQIVRAALERVNREMSHHKFKMTMAVLRECFHLESMGLTNIAMLYEIVLGYHLVSMPMAWLAMAAQGKRGLSEEDRAACERVVSLLPSLVFFQGHAKIRNAIEFYATKDKLVSLADNLLRDDSWTYEDRLVEPVVFTMPEK